MRKKLKTKISLSLLNDNLEKMKEISEKNFSSISREIDLMILEKLKEREAKEVQGAN